MFLSILKALSLLAILFFLILIWNSSERVEQELIEMKSLLRMPARYKEIATVSSPMERKWDPSLPNLLEEDIFYSKTLPEMLGKDFVAQGTFMDATLGRPDNLHPFSGFAQVSAWNGMCVGSVSRMKFGIYETFAPNFALKMEERGDPPEYWVHLREDLFWQPLEENWFPAGFELDPRFLEKHQVTAHDFKFYFDALMNPHVAEAGAVALRTFYRDMEEIEVIDDLTFVVRWKTPKYIAKALTGGLRPLPRFVYQYFADGKKIVEDDQDPLTYRKNPIFALNFSNHWAKNVIVSCAGWVFDGMSDRMIRFRKNTDYFFPLEVLVDGMEIEIRSSFESMWQDFKEKKLDTYLLRPEQLLELGQFLKSPYYRSQKENQAAIERLDYISRAYSYIGWNQARNLFASKKVRQALTMGIDRERIIRQTLNGMGVPIHGSFWVGSPSSDPNLKPWPYDPFKAKRMLEEEGWYDSDGDGIVDKEIDGQRVPFRFALTYYVKNPTAKAVVEYVASALSALGIRVDLNGVDVADITKVFEDKNFDALLLNWSLGTPPEDPRQLWYSSEAAKKGSSNAVGFKNKEADQIIDQLDFEKDSKNRLALYHRFDQIIHEEQPYTFLYTPKSTLLYREWVKNVFIPADKQTLIPGANVKEPDLGVAYKEL